MTAPDNDLQQTARFDAALDVLAQLIGHASTQADAAREAGDPGGEQEWLQRRDEWAMRRNALEPGDLAAVEQIIERDSVVLTSGNSAS